MLARCQGLVPGQSEAGATSWDDKKFKWPGGDSKSPANAQMWAIAPSMGRRQEPG